MATKSGSGGGKRDLHVRVKTARKRTNASTRWLERQLNDPYVKQAKREGYRSRAAYKLAELNAKFQFLKPGARVLDLGAAPGGWVQVALEHGCSALGVDLLAIPPIAGAKLMQLDFMDDAAPTLIERELGGKVDVVLSDMAANTTGHGPTDHLRIVALAEAAYAFAGQVLLPGGTFICKVFQGGTEGELLRLVKQSFTTVKHAKPKASRQDSAETYLVALGFRG